MRIVTLSALLTVFSLPNRVLSDAKVSEWIGQYKMNHDGIEGTLSILDSKQDCASSPWCNLVLKYADRDGKSSEGKIERIDQNFQHMVFFINFLNNTQRFDAYLFSWDKTKMAGTTYWEGRSYGFFGNKVSDIDVGGSNDLLSRTVLNNGAVELRYRDGRIVRKFKGGYDIVLPNGQSRRISYVQVQPSELTPPPDLPAEPGLSWLDGYNAGLLGVIQDLLGKDTVAIHNYMSSEEKMTTPRKINSRRECIGWLMR